MWGNENSIKQIAPMSNDDKDKCVQNFIKEV